ncbi:MAG TPA: RluA family pseudouridine synthase [Polyangiales bacterium]|nr:RluA family pseudouridine synthase [Polyangiales bacterium]
MEKNPGLCEGSEMPAFELEVSDGDAGERLDVVLARRVPGLSRGRARALLEAGRVRVGGRLVKKSYLLQEGDRVTLDLLPGPADFHATPDPELPLEILLETESFVVVDKPAGVPSHPLEEGERGTLAGALVARYPEMRGVGYRRREPGIVHRLDTDTSGVMLAARTAEAFRALREDLRAGRIEKRYLARCVGVVSAPSIIEIPIASDPRDSRKVRACTDEREAKRLRARPARTEVISSKPAPHGSLVEVRANHARRHQIRVHLASIGHPLLGDTLYGGPRLDHPDRHLLHAVSLKIGTLSITTSAWNHEASDVKIAASDH